MNTIMGILLLDSISLVVVFVAIVRVVTIPAERWAHGRMSKTAWVTAAVWFIVSAHSVALPLGAIAAIWQTRMLNRTNRPEETGVPFAAGTAEAADVEERS